jgi:hypothetical protein
VRRRLLVALLVLGSGLAPGCGPGYLHSHPHICPDGAARSHRHWHSEDGTDGHHAPEGGHPAYHREMTWSD